MSDKREFYLQADNKDIQTFEYLASETPCYDNDIHVIDYASYERAITALKKAHGALKVAKSALKDLKWAGNGKGIYCVEDARAANAMRVSSQLSNALTDLETDFPELKEGAE